MVSLKGTEVVCSKDSTRLGQGFYRDGKRLAVQDGDFMVCGFDICPETYKPVMVPVEVLSRAEVCIGSTILLD